MANRSEDVRRARAALMLQRKVMGATYADIAKEFKVGLQTVERELKWGREQGLIQDYTDQLNVNVMPDVVKALHAAVIAGDTHVALEIAKGMGVLKRQRAAEPEPPSEEDSLEAYIKVTRKKHEVLPATDEEGPDGGDESAAVLDGHVVLALEEGTQVVGEVPLKASLPDGAKQ